MKYDVDCPNCDRQALAREGDLPHKSFLPVELRPYSLAVCQSCRHALLLLSGEIAPDTDPDDLPARAAPVLWPVTGREIPESVPQRVRQELDDARSTLRSGSPSSAVVHVRRLLEAVCADHGVTGRTLFHALRELRRRELIDGWLLAWAQELRELGNAAAHLGEQQLSKDEAVDAVTLAEALVEYMYVFSPKYRAFRKARPQPAKARTLIPDTTAMRILRKYHIAFSVHPYPHDPAHTKSRLAVAAGLGIAPSRMLKAVILYLGEHAVLAMAPVEDVVDEVALAHAFGAEAARIATRADVVRIGDSISADILSPLALPYLPSVLDVGAAGAGSVYVSSGRHGLELELAPADLIKITSARTAAIVK